MQDAKLLRAKDKRLDWTRCKKMLKLINEETKIVDPIDISYIYNGYSPMSVKLIECMFREQGFRAIDDRLKLFGGAQIASANEADLFQPARYGGPVNDMPKKKVIIYFVGGVTYGEIAAIRFLNKCFREF